MSISIRWKIVLVIVAPMVLICSLLFLFNTFRLQQWITQNVEARMTELVRSNVRSFDARLSEVAHIARMTAALLEDKPAMATEEVLDQLQRNLELNPLVYASAVCFEAFQHDPQKRLVMCYVHREGASMKRGDPSESGYDYTEEKQEYWHLPRNTGKPVWTEPYFDEGAGNILMCTYSVPFFKAGKFAGIATIDIALEQLRELVAIDMPEESDFRVISKKGVFVYCPVHELINQSSLETFQAVGRPDLVALVHQVVAGAEGMEKLPGLRIPGMQWLFYAPVKSTQWGFIARISEDRALSFIRGQFRQGVLIILGALMLILVCFWFLSFQLSQRIVRLGAAVSELSKGNFNIQTEWTSKDEIGLLGNAFNAMAQKLEQRDQQLRESEERLSLALNVSGAGIWRWNLLTDEVLLDTRFYEMLGYDLEEFPSTIKAFRSFHRPEEYERIKQECDAHIRGESPLFESEYSMRKKNGSWLWVLSRGRVISWNKQGEPESFIGATLDISRRKEAEARNLAFERQLQHAQKLESLAVLAGGIAHDFNNILVSILGYSDLALEELPPQTPARASIKEIEKGALRAADLAAQMLAYSGRGRFELEPIQLSALVKKMGAFPDLSIPKTTILSVSLTRDLPPIEGDLSQISQLLSNLITNASEAIGEKEGAISVATGLLVCDGALLESMNASKELKPGRYVYLEVTDSGCGMDSETQEKVFEPFFSTKFVGRGLGMAAVQGIVRGHQGAIVINSAPGQGSRVKVLFPVYDAPVAQPVEEIKDSAKALPPPHSDLLLLVDDEESVRMLGKKMLERLGYDLITAANGLEALELYQDHAQEIACVLMDLTMPHMDGQECFYELRKIRSDLPVIISSGYTEEEISQRFSGEKLTNFIQKPYKLLELKNKLNEVLES